MFYASWGLLETVRLEVVHLLVAADVILLDILLVVFLNTLLDGRRVLAEPVIVLRLDLVAIADRRKNQRGDDEPLNDAAQRECRLAAALALLNIRNAMSGLLRHLQTLTGTALEAILLDQTFTTNRTTAYRAVSNGQAIGVIQTNGTIQRLSHRFLLLGSG